jgi:MFS family permease
VSTESTCRSAFQQELSNRATLPVKALAQLMVVLDATIVNIALPSAQRDLAFSNADRQWVVTAYSLAFGGCCCSAAGCRTWSDGGGC